MKELKISDDLILKVPNSEYKMLKKELEFLFILARLCDYTIDKSTVYTKKTYIPSHMIEFVGKTKITLFITMHSDENKTFKMGSIFPEDKVCYSIKAFRRRIKQAIKLL